MTAQVVQIWGGEGNAAIIVSNNSPQAVTVGNMMLVMQYIATGSPPSNCNTHLGNPLVLAPNLPVNGTGNANSGGGLFVYTCNTITHAGTEYITSDVGVAGDKYQGLFGVEISGAAGLDISPVPWFDNTFVQSHSGNTFSTLTIGDTLICFSVTPGELSTAFTSGSGWVIPANGINSDGLNYGTSFIQIHVNVPVGSYTGAFITNNFPEIYQVTFAIKAAAATQFFNNWIEIND